MVDFNEALKEKYAPSKAPPEIDFSAKLREEYTHEIPSTAMTEQQELQLKYGPLEKPGLGDLGLRSRLSVSRNIEAKKKKFEEAYPYGELRKDEKSGVLLFRKTPNENWEKVDAGMFEKFELGDIADIVGDIPAIAGEALFTKGTKFGTKPLSTLFRAGAGAGVGDIARSGSEIAKGYPAPEIWESAKTEAMLGAGGELAGAVLGSAINAARGAGAVAPTLFAKKTMRQAEKAGLPRLHPGQATDNILLQAFVRQSRALSGKIHQYERKQADAALDLLETLRARDITMPLGQDLEKALARREAEIIKRITRTSLQSQTFGGKALAEGVEEYKITSGRAVSQNYAYARSLGEPGFDISSAVEVANETTAGVQALLKSGELDRVGKVPGELLEVAEMIKNLNPQTIIDSRLAASRGAAAPYDVLSEARSQLYDLTQPVDGVVRNEHRLARNMYNAITNVLKTPLGVESLPFRRAWEKATTSAAKRFDVLEQDFVAKALRAHKGGDVEGLYRSLFRPNNANQVAFVKKVLPSNKWKDFKQTAVSDLLSSPYEMWNKLKSFDDATLEAVFSSVERDTLRKSAFQFKRLDEAGVRSAVFRQSTANGVVRDIISNMNTAGADELFKLTGGPETELGRRMRAGVMEWIYKDMRATVRSKFGKDIDRASILNSMETLRKTGMLKFLTQADKRIIHGVLPDYLSLVRSLGMDTGESIRRMTIIQNLTDKTKDAVLDILEEVFVGRVMTSGAGQRLVYGFGQKHWNMGSLKRLSAAIAIVAKDYEEETQE